LLRHRIKCYTIRGGLASPSFASRERACPTEDVETAPRAAGRIGPRQKHKRLLIRFHNTRPFWPPSRQENGLCRFPLRIPLVRAQIGKPPAPARGRNRPRHPWIDRADRASRSVRSSARRGSESIGREVMVFEGCRNAGRVLCSLAMGSIGDLSRMRTHSTHPVARAGVSATHSPINNPLRRTTRNGLPKPPQSQRLMRVASRKSRAPAWWWRCGKGRPVEAPAPPREFPNRVVGRAFLPDSACGTRRRPGRRPLSRGDHPRASAQENAVQATRADARVVSSLKDCSTNRSDRAAWARRWAT